MNTRKLILNDGTIIEGGDAGLSSNGNLWLWFTGYTMMQTVTIFLDPVKTASITFWRTEGAEDTYEGYTNCTNINIDANGTMHVCLTREG